MGGTRGEGVEGGKERKVESRVSFVLSHPSLSLSQLSISLTSSKIATSIIL